ncbi:hypothetical protein A3Q56_00994 [Intoshia linei]|uniref:Uncharacterized protein n=1 Tax=Intoshia linei TaxID=1819745 RepID=A0A177BAH6_9BILA|nr:hypothetical protein A3Q56_00994 [Intoshia linei]
MADLVDSAATICNANFADYACFRNLFEGSIKTFCYTLGHRKFKVYYNQKACLATVGSDGCKKMVNKSSWITKNKQAMHHQKQEYQHISKRNLHISKQTNNQKHFFDPNSLCQ